MKEDRGVKQYPPRHPSTLSSGYEIHDDREYVDTTEISTGLGSIFELLKSLVSLVLWSNRSPDGESSPDDSDGDVETGLRKSANEHALPSDTSYQQVSSVMTPVRFPSTINELFAFESPPSMATTYPLPEGDPPLIPLLPLPRLRNEE